MQNPELYSFYRPIHWDNGTDWDEWRFSTGATANIIKLHDEFFVLSLNHVMDQTAKGWDVTDCRIAWRNQTEAYCKLGQKITFKLPDNSENKLFADICIYRLVGPSCPVEPHKKGEYLEINSFDMDRSHFPHYLSGFPTYAQNPDYEARELNGVGLIIVGDIETTVDKGMYKFSSEELKGVDANGYSGSLITSNVLGHICLEGICIQGSGAKDIDFIYFIGESVLKAQIYAAYHALSC